MMISYTAVFAVRYFLVFSCVYIFSPRWLRHVEGVVARSVQIIPQTSQGTCFNQHTLEHTGAFDSACMCCAWYSACPCVKYHQAHNLRCAWALYRDTLHSVSSRMFYVHGCFAFGELSSAGA